MQQKEFRQLIYQQLSGVYPKQEIDALFFRLLEFYTKTTRTSFLVEPSTEIIEESTIVQLNNAIDSLQKKIPIQYILGQADFFGSTFKVNSDVLIPRQETEELVNWIVEEHKNHPLKILDIGTGSGCIAISLAKHLPKAKVTAIDISEKALEVARENAQQNKVEIDFKQLDILQVKSLMGKFDIIVSNPPYVRNLEKEEIHANVLDYEPHLALFVSDENPLIFYDKISDLAKNHLDEGGILYFEINQYLGNEMVDLLIQKGFQNVILKKDLMENHRMVRAEKCEVKNIDIANKL